MPNSNRKQGLFTNYNRPKRRQNITTDSECENAIAKWYYNKSDQARNTKKLHNIAAFRTLIGTSDKELQKSPHQVRANATNRCFDNCYINPFSEDINHDFLHRPVSTMLAYVGDTEKMIYLLKSKYFNTPKQKYKAPCPYQKKKKKKKIP